MRLYKGWYFSWGTRPLGQPWHSLALAVVGGVCVGLALYSYFSTQSFLSTAQEATGTVVDVVQRGDMFYPVVKYTDTTGKIHTLRASVGSSPPPFRRGEQVVVYYSIENPGKAELGNFWQLWLFAIVMAILGTAFLVAAMLLWIFRHQVFDLAGYPELSGPRTSLPQTPEDGTFQGDR